MYACLPDRMPPAPVEIKRPELVGFGENDDGGLNVPLMDPVHLIFNEQMDPASFEGNFILHSTSGAIEGEFSTSTSADSVIVFNPSVSMNPAERYTIEVLGGVSDIHGNSRLSPREEQIPRKSWFFTTGDYANNGFPYIYITDRLGELVYRVGQIHTYIDSARMTESSEELRFTPEGSRLVIVNKANPGFLTVVDPATMSVTGTIEAGVGSEHLYLSNDKAYVSDVSGKSVSIINLNSMALESTMSFSDGFSPRDIVYNSISNKIYLSSNSRNDFAKLRVVNADDGNDFYDIEDIMPTDRTEDMEISNDGEYIFLIERRSNILIIFNTSEEAIVDTIHTQYFQNVDGVISQDAYYFISTALDNRSAVFKIDLSTQAVAMQLELDITGLTSLGATAAGELLYVASPNDSTLKIIETSTLTQITEAKVPGSLQSVAVSVLNYQ